MRKSLVILAAAAGLLCACSTAGRYVTFQESTLSASRKAVRNGQNAKAYKALISKADALLSAKALSVTMQGVAPPSGDKHDYMSMGPYWWPDPSKPDGLPYIRRDGAVNPETKRMEAHSYLGKTTGNVQTLAYAWYFSGEEKYARKAAELLRVFFLDPETRMNPNLTYGQSIPGKCTGRGIGLIDTRGLAATVDAILLLDSSKSWTRQDKAGMQEWFQAFYTWMLESEIGKDEGVQKNNHGSAYDLQICAYTRYCGHPELARRQLENVTRKRLDVQFLPDGSQPLELRRTNSWGYSSMNLNLWMELSDAARNLGIDLWTWKSKDGVGLKEAAEWYFPFLRGEKPWIKKDLSPRRTPVGMHRVLLEYCRRYCPERYPEFLEQLRTFTGDTQYDPAASVINLLYPL